jgi:hypothetical protein
MPRINIVQDGGSYGPKSGYGYWSAYLLENHWRKIDFAAVASTEKQMRLIVTKWIPNAVIKVCPKTWTRKEKTPDAGS